LEHLLFNGRESTKKNNAKTTPPPKLKNTQHIEHHQKIKLSLSITYKKQNKTKPKKKNNKQPHFASSFPISSTIKSGGPGSPSKRGAASRAPALHLHEGGPGGANVGKRIVGGERRRKP
jgi:hypothetical protein